MVMKLSRPSASWSTSEYPRLTARSSDADRLLGLKVGADDYVAKPFSTRDLVERKSLEQRMLDEARKKRDSELAGKDAVSSAIISAEADVAAEQRVRDHRGGGARGGGLPLLQHAVEVHGLVPGHAHR